jgi:membrane-associated phospholipid phosphatase
MTSRVNQIEKRVRHGQTLILKKRFLLIILICCIQTVYIPTSNRILGGIEPKLPIDIFPIWAVWVVPYILCYPLWFFGILWAILKMEDRFFRSLVAAFLLTCTVSISIFIFFPTYVKPATFYANDIFTSLLRFIHENAGRYDALPSPHIYITVLLALFYDRWYPRYKSYWILIPIIVSLSTLFTGQHYVADIAGGVVVAFLGFHFGLRWAGLPIVRRQPAKARILQPPL